MTATLSGVNDKTYDATTSTTGGIFSDDRISGDVLTVNTSSITFDNKNVGTGKTVTATGLNLTGIDAGNYTLAANTATDTADINKATLQVTALDQSRIYGEANPSLVGTITGFVNSETVAELNTLPSYSTTATLDSNTGNYTISASGASANNYDFQYNTGTLSIQKAPLSVRLPSLTLSSSDLMTSDLKQYFIYTGFKLADGINNLNQLPSVVRTSSDSGIYALLQGGQDDNYAFDLPSTPAGLKLELRKVDLKALTPFSDALVSYKPTQNFNLFVPSNTPTVENEQEDDVNF